MNDVLMMEAVAAPQELPVAEVLARTLYGEARGEGLPGIEAVACVILNRVAFAKARGRYWWGNTVSQVCLKPGQFSCWNAGDRFHNCFSSSLS